MSTNNETKIRSAYYGIVLFGVVSLFGDIVYEGARSAVPEYMKIMGASATFVGLIIGFGEFLAYAIRLPAGSFVDIFGLYWLTTFIGYASLFSIPLLAIAPSLAWVALFVFLERFGKGVRNPSRDALLSVVSKDVGSGKAFGIHEFLDQIGAVTGPTIVAAILFFTNNSFRTAFASLSPFVVLCLLALFFAYTFTKERTKAIESRKEKINMREEFSKIPKHFWLYSISAFLSTVGFVHFALLSYRLQGLVPDWLVAFSFSLAMAIDAIFALLLGFLYDKYKLKVFYFIFMANSLPAILAILPNPILLILAVASFGIGMGAQESIYRSVVADLTPIHLRGTAYGIFNTLYGLAWTIGGAVAGIFYDFNHPETVAIFSIIMELIAFYFTLKVEKFLNR